MHERGRHQRGNMLKCSSMQPRFLQSKPLKSSGRVECAKDKVLKFID